jgi:hypothetical protein
VSYRWQHLLKKLARRNPHLWKRWRGIQLPRCHPLFKRVKGPPEPWERRD